MKHYHLLLLVSLLVAITLSAQKKARVELVTTNNSIKGEPYIILPRAGIKVRLSIVEFNYKIGDSLRSYINIKKGGCSDSVMAKKLAFLSAKYDVNVEVLLKLLSRDPLTDKEELKISKLDKEIKFSGVSLLDPKKIYKYVRLKSPLNSGLLSLEYDENGILTSSKQTDEPKLIPALISVVSSVAGIVTGAKGATMDTSTSKTMQSDPCIAVHRKMEMDLDKALSSYYTYLTAGTPQFSEKQYEKGREKKEEDVSKEFAKLFYSKTIKIIPVELTYVIPEGSGNSANSYDLFVFDAATGKIQVLASDTDKLLLTPISYFNPQATLRNPVKLNISTIPAPFNKAALMNGLFSEPGKLTVVYNIPQSMRVALLKPGSTEAYMDSVMKIPQRGTVGFMSMRPSSLELTYDANGELRKITVERKSVLDNTAAATTAAKDLIVAARKEEKTELQLLKERADLLETMKKIRDLEME